jgi:cytochrome d ubiquinol oxidase subunit II
MIEAVTFVLGAALVLYTVLGGADFGAGIWELVQGRRQGGHEALVSRAMGPVWEANHVWLILVLVILFNAFPPAFEQMAISLHIPLSLLLVGITLRGCAFTFRHYDVGPSARAKGIYSVVFEAASLITPLTEGAIVGGLLLGRFPTGPASFAETYVWPWLTPFSGVMAVFLTLLFAYLAAVFLTGEAQDPALAQLFSRRAKAAGAAAAVAGAAVFAAGELSGLPLASRVLSTPVSLASIILATALFWPLCKTLGAPNALPARLLVAAQVALIIAGWMAFQLPAILPGLSIYNAAAPAATLDQLLLALAVGGLLIFPALLFLLFVFKR